MTPFLRTRERLPVEAASLLVHLLAAHILKWQEPISATNELLRFIGENLRKMSSSHQAPSSVL